MLRILERSWHVLATERDPFDQFPMKEGDDAYVMIGTSLGFASEDVQLAWILKGLNHPDPEIQTSALYVGEAIQDELVGVVSTLAAAYARLAESPHDLVRSMAADNLRRLGKTGTDYLLKLQAHPTPAVRKSARVALEHKHLRVESAESSEGVRRAGFFPWVASLTRKIWQLGELKG